MKQIRQIKFYKAMITFYVVMGMLMLCLVNEHMSIVTLAGVMLLVTICFMAALGYQSLISSNWRDIRANADMDRPE